MKVIVHLLEDQYNGNRRTQLVLTQVDSIRMDPRDFGQRVTIGNNGGALGYANVIKIEVWP